MEAPTEAISPGLAAALMVDLNHERQMIRAYRLHVQMALSPRLRRALEEGLAIKLLHESKLEQVARTIPSQNGPSQRTPGRREILGWYYDREHALALRYREQAGLSEDSGVGRLLDELAADQIELATLFKGLYRDFSAA